MTGNLAYHQILAEHYSQDAYRWDDVARVPYLSVDADGSAGDSFLSYDDETSCAEKVDYVRDKGIGGLIIWELAGGYLPQGNAPRDPLLQAVKQAAAP